jgi:hypothetical protein
MVFLFLCLSSENTCIICLTRLPSATAFAGDLLFFLLVWEGFGCGLESV